MTLPAGTQKVDVQIRVACFSLGTILLAAGFGVVRAARAVSQKKANSIFAPTPINASAVCRHCGKVCRSCFTVSNQGQVVCSQACATASVQAVALSRPPRFDTELLKLPAYFCFAVAFLMFPLMIFYEESWPERLLLLFGMLIFGAAGADFLSMSAGRKSSQAMLHP
jgi:hypothetical protein